MHGADPVFGINNLVRGFRTFSLRGLQRVPEGEQAAAVAQSGSSPIPSRGLYRGIGPSPPAALGGVEPSSGGLLVRFPPLGSEFCQLGLKLAAR